MSRTFFDEERTKSKVDTLIFFFLLGNFILNL
jgi:hypothetical protein